MEFIALEMDVNCTLITQQNSRIEEVAEGDLKIHDNHKEELKTYPDSWNSTSHSFLKFSQSYHFRQIIDFYNIGADQRVKTALKKNHWSGTLTPTISNIAGVEASDWDVLQT